MIIFLWITYSRIFAVFVLALAAKIIICLSVGQIIHTLRIYVFHRIGS